ncbi:SAG family member [Eimeria mitis]|uniref:SAG family member n=1 Tax=Eimeria mitis TaxID=44415 RepID=U6JV59_9EIME|nr:SAG family member [Eimeria mitis]CDJ27942.1 SAG family member [Eimeria mitis]
MAALKLFSLASASAFVLANAVHQTAKQTSLTPQGTSPTYTVKLGNSGVCLDEMNAAREAAGLEHFEAPAEELTWPQTSAEKTRQPSTAWNRVCKALIAEDSEEGDVGAYANEFQSGTYAFMALESETPDCAAAVKHWKDAASNFTTIPPSKKQEPTLYDKQQNVSLIALYNPSENAAADCRVVTCTLPADQALSRSNIRSAEQDKHGYALLCMTTPDALEGDDAPFDEDQWNKIKASITGSASAVAPSLLALAIAVVGLVAL